MYYMCECITVVMIWWYDMSNNVDYAIPYCDMVVNLEKSSYIGCVHSYMHSYGNGDLGYMFILW
jgi:hypothetical protein